MANRQFNGRVRTPHSEPVLLCFKVAIDGASAVSGLTTGMASYVTVTKPTGTGIYRCTLADPYQVCLWADATLLKAAGTLDADILPVAETNFGTSTPAVVDFQVKKTSDGTALDPTSLTIKFILVLSNSQVTP